MNLSAITSTGLHTGQAALEAVVAVGNLLSAELVCSMTINMTLLAVVLLGAVRLLGAFEPKPRRQREKRA